MLIGTYQLRTMAKRSPILAQTEVLFVNKEEAKKMLHDDTRTSFLLKDCGNYV